MFDTHQQLIELRKQEKELEVISQELNYYVVVVVLIRTKLQSNFLH